MIQLVVDNSKPIPEENPDKLVEVLTFRDILIYLVKFMRETQDIAICE